MKRLELCVLCLLITFVCASFAESKPTETKASMLELCYMLWKSTNYGWDKHQTERAAWVLRNRDGGHRWLQWDYTKEHRAATWKYAVPEGVIAQIHTHPEFTDPRPSKQDIRVAKDIQAPVYTISGSGIWRVGPDGKITKEADNNWHKRIKD